MRPSAPLRAALGRRQAIGLPLLLAAGCSAPPGGAIAASTGGAPGGTGLLLRLQNIGTRPLPAGIATFGQVFTRGELARQAGLSASIGGDPPHPAQIDVKTRWEDGSARFAIVAIRRPELAGRRSADLVLAVAPPQPAVPIALGQALAAHACGVTLAIAGGTTMEVDLLAALRAALAAGTASFWQDGPLATQARVEVAVAGTSLRLVADVTAFEGGGLSVDLQFANDRAMEAVGGHVDYAATVMLDGRVAARERISQQQYTSWHREFSTAANGGQGLGSANAGWLHIGHNARRLVQAAAIAQYDLTLTMPESTLRSYAAMAAAPGWGTPLAANGVYKSMPDAGGRADIGIVTEANSAWLLSQDARAAAVAMGQAEAAGAVPWRYWDAAHGTWLTARHYPRLWVDSRGGSNPVGRPGDPASSGPTQFMEWTGAGSWTPEPAHQPELSFVPYLLTGERWVLDNLLAQAAWNTVANWPGDATQGERFDTLTGKFDLVVRNTQTRAAAWALRQIENAAWAAPDGSPEQAFFRATADANWKWLVAQLPSWTTMQGETAGWLPNFWWTGRIGPWMQDYFASTAISAASRGSQDALTVLNWMKGFLIGRFEHAADGFNPRDGIVYALVVGPIDPATGFATSVYKSWSAMGAALVAANGSNGTGWERSVGEYGKLALCTLAGIWELTGDARARRAYEQLAALNPPFTTAADFAASPSFAVTLPGLYGRAGR